MSIYAEKRREDSGSDSRYYTLRWFVWNGDNMLGTYGIHFGPTEYATDGYGRRTRNLQDPIGGGFAYGASRDYHKLATEEEIAARKVWDAFQALPDEEQDAMYDNDTAPDYPRLVDGCCYFDNRPTCCDGSSLVEVTTDDKRAFEIAAMMANVDREDN